VARRKSQAVAPKREVSATRRLSASEARQLGPGAEHYRAFVGPPDEYDSISATQFAILTAFGLREHHYLLDYGCGSLRGGRLLIPYLDTGRYFGLEPNTWLVDDGVDRELGRDILRIKQPKFLHHDTFGTAEFGRQFDYVLAQSILSHAGSDVLALILRQIRAALADDGLALVTVVEGSRKGPAPPGWIYPWVVPYERGEIRAATREAGLLAARLRWRHPRQRWYVLTTDRARMPGRRLRKLHGIPL
jgi:SAM-dependent methyltransferase